MIKLQIKRGSKNNLPRLADGEYGLALDTTELFIGTLSGNVQVPLLEDGKLPPKIMQNAFDALSEMPGNRTTDTLATADNLDTWTSVITDAGGHELARKVDKEERQPDGKAMWTTTITIGDKVVTVTDKETATGWTREVK